MELKDRLHFLNLYVHSDEPHSVIQMHLCKSPVTFVCISAFRCVHSYIKMHVVLVCKAGHGTAQ
jgi:hypothetical protein